jgi:hypothetical protein
MSFDDARVRQSFIEYVLGLQRDDSKNRLTREFLNVFLDAILESEKHPGSFAISLTKAAQWVKTDKKNFKRLVEPSQSRAKHATNFVKGRDFTYLPEKDKMNREQLELYMTVDTFKQAASRLHTSFGDQVREYLWLVEGALRDWVGSTIKERYQRGELAANPPNPINKIVIAPEIKLSRGIGYYTITFAFKGQKFLYQGITDNIAGRLEKHALQLPLGITLTLVEWVRDDDPEFMEICRRTYDRNDRVPVPETLHGMRDLFYEVPARWKWTTEHCQENLHNAKTSRKAFKEKPEILPTADLYPVRRSQKRPRRKRHEWRDRPVALYPEGRSPVIAPDSYFGLPDVFAGQK